VAVEASGNIDPFKARNMEYILNKVHAGKHEGSKQIASDDPEEISRHETEKSKT
jgi:hypothetical protein